MPVFHLHPVQMITFAHFNTMNSNHSLLRIHPVFRRIHLCVTGQACHHQSYGFFLFDRAVILCKTNFLYCQSFSLRRKIDVTSTPIWTSNSASKNSYTKTEPFRLSFEIILINTIPCTRRLVHRHSARPHQPLVL